MEVAMEILRSLPISKEISPNIFEFSEEYIAPTAPAVGVFSYKLREEITDILVASFLQREDLFNDTTMEFSDIPDPNITSFKSFDGLLIENPTRKFSKVIGSFQEGSNEYKNLLSDSSTFSVPFVQSIYYSPISSKARCKKYVNNALKAYSIKSLHGKEVHHMKLDRSSSDSRFLAILDSHTHKKIHIIHDLENKLEVLEEFEKHNFKYKNILMGGVGSSFKNTVYVLKDLKLSPGETVESVFKQLKDYIVEQISKLINEVCTVLEESLRENDDYMQYLMEFEKKRKVAVYHDKIEEKSDMVGCCFSFAKKFKGAKTFLQKIARKEEKAFKSQKSFKSIKKDFRF